MRPDVEMAVEAAHEVLRQVDTERVTVRWATVITGGNPAEVLVDGDDVLIEVQPTVGAVVADDRVRVEFRESGAALIVGIR